MLSIEDIDELLGIDLLGVIPESKDVLSASNLGEPIILNQESDAGKAYQDAVDRLQGIQRDLRFVTFEKKGFLSRIFGG